MDYRRFELLVDGIAAVIVAAAIAASIPNGGATLIEIVAQLAIVAVVAVACHWGRKAGTLAALVTSVAYLAVRLPLIATNVSGPAILLVVSRIAGYLLLGIVGGEIFGRIKYVFAGSKDVGTIDDFSLVFSEKFAARALRRALSRAERHSEPFSVVLIGIDAVLAADARTDHRRALVRSVANIIRDDVRIVDDVSHLSDGRFAVILAHTNGSGARVVASRLAHAIGSAHSVVPEDVRTECMTAPDDIAAIEAFHAQIDPPDSEADYAASGA